MSDFKDHIQSITDALIATGSESVTQVFYNILNTKNTVFIAVYDEDTAPYHQVLEKLEETLEDDPEKTWTTKDLLREVEKINEEILFEMKEESEEA